MVGWLLQVEREEQGVLAALDEQRDIVARFFQRAPHRDFVRYRILADGQDVVAALQSGLGRHFVGT